MFKKLADLVATRPALILGFWLVVLLICAPVASMTAKRLVGNASALPDSDAQRVNQIIEQDFKLERVDTTLVVTESSLPSDNSAFLAKYNTLIEQLIKLEGVNDVTRFDADSPLRLFGQVEGKTVTATILSTRLEEPDPVIASIRQTVQASELPKTKIYVTGASAITKDFLKISEEDTKSSELRALPLIALVLVFAFGALVAAGIPIGVGLLSITVAMAAVFVVTQFIEVSSFAQAVVTMLGLGAGIDYALLIVNRFREELANGHAPRVAAANATRTAGRAVAFSGLTVAIAMAALLIPNLTFVRSMGIAGVIVVLMTVLVSTSAVPALLAIIGERVNSPRRLQLKSTSSGKGSAFWGYWAEAVMRRPGVWMLAVAVLLLLIASPALGMKLGYTGAFGLSSNVESRRGLELIRPLDLGGSLDQFEVILESTDFRADRAKWRALDAEIAAWQDVRLVISPFLTSREDFGNDSGSGLAALSNLSERSISRDRKYLRLSVIPKDAIHPPEIQGWLTRLRDAARKAGFEKFYLGGAPVGSQEFTNALVNAMPVAIITVFIATFILLAIAFRSIVIPIKSIIMNSLTVAASYGVITLIFQNGVLASLFSVPTDIGAIDSSLPLVMFAVTFGLSMDYEIFLLSRVQEAHLAGMNTHDAVKTAVQSTAGVITSAALIMLIVFGAFVQGDVVANKTIGLGMAVAVFLDATLVRLVLVPAVMMLAGEWNWWLPKGLAKVMPKLSLEH
ncbi:MAG: MMPL family transporter [Deinococcales bacterium]